MRQSPTFKAYCFGCINVRYAVLALAIGYLIMHVLGMTLLVYMTLNLDGLKKALAPNITTNTQLFSQNIILEEEDQPESSHYVIGDTAILFRNTNVNITVWMSSFVINNPSSADLPTRSQLNMAVVLCSVNAVTAILAICGLIKNSAGCLVPFFLSQVWDIVLTILTTVGLHLTGLTAKEDILDNSSESLNESEEFSTMEWNTQFLFVIQQMSKIMIKMYLLLIICKCIKHLKDQKILIAREQRQHKCKQNILKGNVMIDACPPPAYQSVCQPLDGLPSYPA